MHPILWVDDNIDQFQDFLSVFNKHRPFEGLDNLDAAEKALQAKRYDAVLLDIQMGAEKVFPRLSRFLDICKSTNIFLTSEFYFEEHTRDILSELPSSDQRRLRRIDKTELPGLREDDESEVKEFLARLDADAPFEIYEWDEEGVSSSRGDATLWGVYQELSYEDKISVHNVVSQLTRDSRAQLETEGYVYFVYSGDWASPLYKLKTHSDLPSDRDLVEIAEKTGKAAFVFSLGGGIDDIGSGGCSERSGLDGYPYIRVKKDSFDECIHFDTGNPFTLLNHQYCVDAGLFEEMNMMTEYIAGEMVIYGYYFKDEEVIFEDARGRQFRGTLRAFSSVNWTGLRINSLCAFDCSTETGAKADEPRLCIYRRAGLLGRNILKDLELDMTVDAHSGATEFRSRK